MSIELMISLLRKGQTGDQILEILEEIAKVTDVVPDGFNRLSVLAHQQATLDEIAI